MLTIKQIIKLSEESLEVKLKKKVLPELSYVKGEYDPSEKIIIVYLPNVESEEDFNLTLLHEFVHARDDLISGFVQEENHSVIDYLFELSVESEAVETYENRPEIIDLIKDLYEIKDSKK